MNAYFSREALSCDRVCELSCNLDDMTPEDIGFAMERLLEVMVDAPRKRFGLPIGKDFTVWDLNEEFTVDPENFVSMGKATPFVGWKLFGKCMLTVCDGKIVYQSK